MFVSLPMGDGLAIAHMDAPIHPQPQVVARTTEHDRQTTGSLGIEPCVGIRCAG